MQRTDLFLAAYSLVRKSGFLNTRPGKRLFSSSYYAYKRWWEDPFHALAQRVPTLFRGGHILDVGANLGYCSLVFARVADKGRRVYGFEPEPSNLSSFRETVRRRGLEQVVLPIHAAVGEVEGTAEIVLNDHHHADHRVRTPAGAKYGSQFQRALTVPAVSVDGFVRRERISPVSFIKVDVQGYELPVCRGMERTLAANPECAVALEYAPDAMREMGFDPEALMRWCSDQGFRIYTLERNGELREGIVMNGREYIDIVLSRKPLHSVP